MSFTSVSYWWDWATGIAPGSAIECAPPGRRKEPPTGGRTGAGHYMPQLFRLTFAIPGGVRQDADRFSAVSYGFKVFSDQSAGWENRPLSLVRDFIDVVGPAPPLVPRSHHRDDAGKDRLEVIRVYRKAFGAQVADAGRCKAEFQGNHSLTYRNGKHFVSRASCGNIQLARQVAGQARRMQSGEQVVADGESVRGKGCHFLDRLRSGSPMWQ